MKPQYTKADLETYQFAGGLMTILADGAFTGGHYSLLLAHIPPGNTTPPHFHDTDSETLVILGGAMMAETPDHSITLDRGTAAVLPPRQVHRLSNPRDDAASYLLLCAPPGFEEFVRRAGTRVNESAALPRQMNEEDVRLMVEYAPEFGVRLTDGAELAHTTSNQVPNGPRETFVAFGATIEILAHLEDDTGGIVLIRATAMSPDSGLPPRTASLATDVQFFAGTTGSNGSRHGTLASTFEPAMLAVTTGNVLRLLREDRVPEPVDADGGPLQKLLLVLTTLHATGGAELEDAADFAGDAPGATRGLPIR